MGSPLFGSNFLFSAYEQADFFGKLIFISLFGLSIVCWTVLIYKTRQLQKVKKQLPFFEQLFKEHKQHLLSLKLRESDGMHPVSKLFSSLQEKTVEILEKNQFFLNKQDATQSDVFLSEKDFDVIESHVLTTISKETKNLEKHLFVLATTTTLAPFLGLLGTVWGILITFSGLKSGGSFASNTMVLGGLSTALVTTVLGLVIAIPALIFYNYLKHAQKNIFTEMENVLYRLLSLLELQYRKPSG